MRRYAIVTGAVAYVVLAPVVNLLAVLYMRRGAETALPNGGAS